MKEKDFNDFQERVLEWTLACFGEVISADRVERNFRFLEEALELVQSCGLNKDQALQLVDYVFDRPMGEKVQETGGVLVTLAALCNANDISVPEAGEKELLRVWGKIELIREKQAAKKIKSGPLP